MQAVALIVNVLLLFIFLPPQSHQLPIQLIQLSLLLLHRAFMSCIVELELSADQVYPCMLTDYLLRQMLFHSLRLQPILLRGTDDTQQLALGDLHHQPQLGNLSF